MNGNPLTESGVMRTDLRLPGARRGKVRDTYTLPGAAGDPDRLLIVATDRISAFDVVMPTPIPGKGRLLTEMAAFWLRWIEAQGLCRTHLISTDAGEIPDDAFGEPTRAVLQGRVTIGQRCRVLPVECVVRGYIEGSGWKDYLETGSICGIALPSGLQRCERLPEPIFTPATKAEDGEHDANIGFDAAAATVDGIAGPGTMAWLRDTSIAIYNAAHAHAAERGLILADTKFEFGLPLGTDGEPTGSEPILIDEALTPDSSRFWPADDYEAGRTQASFDKQFVREYLETLVASGAWAKSPPGPLLPAEVVRGTLARYREACERLTKV